MTADSSVPQDAGSLDFSVEELVALSGLLKHRLLPGLGESPLRSLDDEQESLVCRTALHSLIARKIVQIGEEEPEVVGSVAAVLETASYPYILGRAEYAKAGSLYETRFYSARVAIGVEHTPLTGAVHRITPFDTTELLQRVVTFVRLEARPTVDVQPLTVTPEQLRECITAATRGDDQESLAPFIAAGADRATADQFVSALMHGVGSSRVTFLHRPDGTHVAGGDLAWLDGNEHGLWLTPAIDRPSDAGATAAVESVTIEATTAAEIASTLLSYLPQPD